MTDDPWLERWLPLIASKAEGLPILELGCGSGRDTQVLADVGHRVVGVDLSASAVKKAAARVPNCQFYCQDIRAPFPVQTTNVVLASLSLHYFPWPRPSRSLVASAPPFARLGCCSVGSTPRKITTSALPVILKSNRTTTSSTAVSYTHLTLP